MRPIVNMPEEDRATDIGNMHKKFGKDRAYGSTDILSDRQTDIQTDRQTQSTQYFARNKRKNTDHTCELTANITYVECYIFIYLLHIHHFIQKVS